MLSCYSIELRDENEAEAEIVVALVGVVVVAISNATVVVVVVPRAATVHAIRTLDYCPNLERTFLRKPLASACCVNAVTAIA